MTSKTPKFNKALSEVLQDLQPHKRVCEECSREFQVLAEDIEFYKMLQVPPPSQCVACRKRKRRAFVNYTTFYKRRCDVPSHDDAMISQIPDGSRFPVYDFDYYWSQSWDPMSFGFEGDLQMSFFDSFFELSSRMPQPPTTRDPMSVNSEYTAYGLQLKNCYYLFGGLYSENVYYGNWPVQAKDCVDVLIPWSSERCYEVVYSRHCYQCKFIYFSRNCIESSFLYDCRGCEYCFLCVGLRNRKYCFFNEQLMKEEYEERLQGIDLRDFLQFSKWRAEFIKLFLQTPKRASMNERVTNSTGALLDGARDCFDCFFSIDGERLRYTEANVNLKDSMDMFLGTGASLCYFCVLPYDASRSKFCLGLRGQCMELEYSWNCKTCSYCFGCVGLHNKQFCIFNKQYEENEYWMLVDALKTKMLERGEYGRYFPMSFSPFPYNTSFAQFSHPLSEEEAKKEGLFWGESSQDSEFLGERISSSEIPNNLRDVSPDIMKSAILCEETGKPFRITNFELDFYKREGVALPRVHPSQRLLERFSWVGFLQSFQTICSKCGSSISVYVIPERQKNFLCEDCYNK